jgi:hypothetical protein
VFHYAYNNCGPTVSSDTITINNVGISNAAEPVTNFNIYPNPTHGSAEIFYALVNSTTVTLEVFDAVGNLVKSTTESKYPGTYTAHFDARSGVYFVRLTAGNKILNKRLTIIE